MHQNENLQTKLTSEIDNKQYQINPGFKCVLSCLKILESDSLSNYKKVVLVAKTFFQKAIPPDAISLFHQFVSHETFYNNCKSCDYPIMDFFQDASEIYASFLSEYNINLIKSDIHWLEFTTLLSCLPQSCALGKKIAIRTLDKASFPKEKHGDIAALKEQFALKQTKTKKEEQFTSLLNESLEKGENIQEIINTLKKEVHFK